MVKGLRIWVYRPDVEAKERRINPHFVFNAAGEKYFDVMDREKESLERYHSLKEKTAKRVFCSKIEVPCE